MSDAPPPAAPTPPNDGTGSSVPGDAAPTTPPPATPPPPPGAATPPPQPAQPTPAYAAPPPPGAYQQVQPLSQSDEKLWATLIHIGGIFFSFLPALIGYLVLKDRGPFVRQHTATALNFQLSMLIYSVALTVIGTILLFVLIGIVFFFALIAIAVIVVVFSIIAAVKANQGQPYTYPLSITFVR